MQDGRWEMQDSGGTVRTWFTEIGQDMVYGFDSWLNGYLGFGLLWLGRLCGWGFFIGAASGPNES